MRYWLKDIPYLWQHKWKAQAFEERHGNYLVSQGLRASVSRWVSSASLMFWMPLFSGQNGWKLHIEFKQSSNRDGVIWPASSFASVALTPHVSYLKLLVSSCTNPATRTSPTVSTKGLTLFPLDFKDENYPVWFGGIVGFKMFGALYRLEIQNETCVHFNPPECNTP